MLQTEKTAEKEIIDKGIEQGAAKLTQDEITSVIQKLLKSEGGARLKTYIETCGRFVEMHPNREHNFCCGAGGGVINCGPPFKAKRVTSSRAKAQQLAEAKSRGAETIIAPCHNCHGGLEDIVNHYGLNMEIKFLGDIIYQCIDKS